MLCVVDVCLVTLRQINAYRTLACCLKWHGGIFVARMLGMSLSFYMPSYFGINYDALFARHTSYNNSDNSDVKKA